MKNQLVTLMLGITVLATSSAFAGTDLELDGSKSTAKKLYVGYGAKNKIEPLRTRILSGRDEGVAYVPVGLPHSHHVFLALSGFLKSSTHSYSNLPHPICDMEKNKPQGYPTNIETKVDDLD